MLLIGFGGVTGEKDVGGLRFYTRLSLTTSTTTTTITFTPGLVLLPHLPLLHGPGLPDVHRLLGPGEHPGGFASGRLYGVQPGECVSG